MDSFRGIQLESLLGLFEDHVVDGKSGLGVELVGNDETATERIGCCLSNRDLD